MGTVQLSAGEWVPREGYSKHVQHELSLILQGAIEVESAAEHVSIGAGDVILIPAGQEHRSRATADTQLVWFWFGEDAE
jgi:mannose-6-phosphate isomerase-like protein (cupin superfamily)